MSVLDDYAIFITIAVCSFICGAFAAVVVTQKYYFRLGSEGKPICMYYYKGHDKMMECLTFSTHFKGVLDE